MYVLLNIALLAATLHQVTASPALVRRGETPAYFADPSSSPYCTWWYDNESETDCKAIAGQFGASFEDFLRWVSGSLPAFQTLKTLTCCKEPSRR
jgi:hypothetical protein